VISGALSAKNARTEARLMNGNGINGQRDQRAMKLTGDEIN
jgi:hypothetical protein